MIDKKEEFDEIKFERDIMDGVYLPIIGTTCAHDIMVKDPDQEMTNFIAKHAPPYGHPLGIFSPVQWKLFVKFVAIGWKAGQKSLIDEAICRICKGQGWVCENHPGNAWMGGDQECCGGAGMPCSCMKGKI